MKGEDPSFWRVCDANLNRAREGLRVCEEIARFVLHKEDLTRQCQRLRYDLAALMRRFPQERLLKGRNIRLDAGRPGKRGAPKSHAGYPDLLKANVRRVQEAFRVLEELARLRSPETALSFSRLRFRAYDLEQDLLSRLPALQHR